MATASTALAEFRRRAHEPWLDTAALPALFVLEPFMHVAGSVVASLSPLAILQALGATERLADDAARATVVDAVERLGVRTIVNCGEGTVRPDRARGGERLLAGCTRLRSDPVLAPILAARGVTLEALWFDTQEGDIHRWDERARRFELLADRGLRQFVADVERRASRTEERVSASA